MGQGDICPNTDAKGGEAIELRTRDADELACKLAYECAWRLCDDALKTLESQRTRAVALLSLTIVAAGIVASSLLRANIIDDVGAIGVMGMMAFGLSTLVIMVCAAIVAWPLDTETALRPSQIIANYVNPYKGVEVRHGFIDVLHATWRLPTTR